MKRIAIDYGEVFQFALSYCVANNSAVSVNQCGARGSYRDLLINSCRRKCQVERKGAAAGSGDLLAFLFQEAVCARLELVAARSSHRDSEAPFAVAHRGAFDASSSLNRDNFGCRNHGAGSVPDYALKNDIVEIIRTRGGGCYE